MGIEPLGTLEKISSLVEYREWVPPVMETEGDEPGDGALEEAVAKAKSSEIL